MDIKKIMIRSIMFISSYFPLYLFLLIINYKIFIDWQKYSYTAWMYISFLIILLIISLLSLFLLLKCSVSSSYEIKNLKRANENVITYVFTYIVPILSISLENIPMLIVNFLLFILIWFLYIKLNIIYLNPLWALAGYIYYEDQDYHIITNMQFEDLKRRKNMFIRGTYLTNGVFLAKKEDNAI